jgi:hypothetical protein
MSPFDLPTNIDLSNLYFISFCRGIGLFLVCLTVWENAGISENYRFKMDYEEQDKKMEIY